MIYLKKYNEAFAKPRTDFISSEREKLTTIKGGEQQDIAHWEVIVKNDKPFLKISTDDDIYYMELYNQEGFNKKYGI